MILNYTDTGEGQTIVLLHGMAGSHRYWNAFLPYIREGNRIISMDLLGFGMSPMPNNSKYDYEAHISSIMDTLRYAGIDKPFKLVGHSMGALIALRLATEYPNQVKKLVLAAMPVYKDKQTAHKTITGSSWLKELAYYGFSSRILCTFWCLLLRPLSRRVAPKYLPHLSEESANDSVFHTWFSYSRSLNNIIENQAVVTDFAQVACPTLLLYGKSDFPSYLTNLKASTNRPNINILVLEGTHQIVYEQPVVLAEWLVS